ncbi:hypothetical protein WA026_000113, partial [Henosepilachna vigintioctopunctata]
RLRWLLGKLDYVNNAIILYNLTRRNVNKHDLLNRSVRMLVYRSETSCRTAVIVRNFVSKSGEVFHNNIRAEVSKALHEEFGFSVLFTPRVWYERYFSWGDNDGDYRPDAMVSRLYANNLCLYEIWVF